MPSCVRGPLRILHIDATRGITAASLLAALVDAGVATSPLLRALASLELPVDLRFQSCAEGTTVHVEPDDAPMLVRMATVRGTLDGMEDAPEAATRIAQDALGRLLVAEVAQDAALRADPFSAFVDARGVAAVAGAAFAVASLATDRVVVSRIGIAESPTPPIVDLLADWAEGLEFDGGATSTDGAAMLRALCGEHDVGAAEPDWRGVVTRGRACDEAGVAIAMGDAEARLSRP